MAVPSGRFEVAARYRRRCRTWEAALLQFGYTPDEVAERLERV